MLTVINTGNGARPAPRRPSARRHPVVAVLLAVLVLLGVSLASVLFGSNRVPVADVFGVLFHRLDGTTATLINDVRIPRTELGLLVGACLGAAGALMQGHTRNALADPGLFGVSAGAGLAVVLGVFTLGVVDPVAIVGLAMLGALVASIVVFGVAAAGSGQASPVPLALAGAAVSALLGALTSFIVLSDRTTLDVYRRWVVGSLAGRGIEVTGVVLPVAVIGMVLAIHNAKALNMLSLGADVARGLGERVGVVRFVGLLAISLLTAAATAAAGPIGFLGLAAPHLARVVTGPDQRLLIPYAAVTGAVLLLASDVVGRLIGGQGEVAVGIVLAILGGPFFVVIARRKALVTL